MNKGYFGVIGLGYVGLPLAIQFTKAGYHVVGIDLDEKRIGQLKTENHTLGIYPTPRWNRRSTKVCSCRPLTMALCEK